MIGRQENAVTRKSKRIIKITEDSSLNHRIPAIYRDTLPRNKFGRIGCKEHYHFPNIFRSSQRVDCQRGWNDMLIMVIENLKPRMVKRRGESGETKEEPRDLICTTSAFPFLPFLLYFTSI